MKASPFPTPRATSLPCPHPLHPQSLVLTPPLPSFPTALLYVLCVTLHISSQAPTSHPTSQPELQEGVEAGCDLCTVRCSGTKNCCHAWHVTQPLAQGT